MNFQTLKDCLDYYQDFHLVNDYSYRANNLSFFNVYTLDELKRHQIKEYVAFRQLKVKNATINRELSFAKASINCVNYDYEIDIHNPFSKFKLDEDDYIANYLTVEQYQALLESSLEFDNQNLHDFILLLCMTGCRPKELLTLRWENVHLKQRQFIVRNFFSKSKKTMYKYLNDTALQTLQRMQLSANEYVFTNPKTNKAYTTFGKSFSRCKQRAGVECTMYDLRHTYASWLVQKKVPIFTVKELLGHGDIVSTMRYAHLDYDSKVEAVNLIC